MTDYLKEIKSNLKSWVDIFWQILPDLLFKIAGNLFPLYMGWIVLKIFQPSNVNAVFDPTSFILYASTFLFSTIYLWYKTNKKGLLFLLFLLVLAIIISLLYANSFINNKNEFKYQSYFIFIITIIVYVIYECINEKKAMNSNFRKSSNEEYSNLKDSFNNQNESS